MEGGRSFDSIPEDIILYILSLLPLNCFLRLKCVCKAWYVLIKDLAEVQLKRSRETSLGMIQLHFTFSDRNMISLDICSLQIGGGLKTVMTKTFNYWKFIDFGQYSINGLICLTDVKNFYVCNPTTEEFVTLPVYPPAPVTSRRCVYQIGFGYCPVTNQYKVLNIFQDFYEQEPVSMVKTAVITLGSSNNSWRILENPPPDYYYNLRDNVYLNGTIYWLVFYDDRCRQLLDITAFDVRDETFRFISQPQGLLYDNKSNLAEHEGRLCFIDSNMDEYFFEIYTMLEDHQWVFRYRFGLGDFVSLGVQSLFSVQYSCLKKGKIMIEPEWTGKWFLYDIKSKAFEAIPVRDSKINWITLIPFEESLTCICWD